MHYKVTKERWKKMPDYYSSLVRPSDPCGHHEIFIAYTYELAPDHARQAAPAYNGKDHCNGKVNPERRPLGWYSRSEGHPQGDRRDTDYKLYYPLDYDVDRASVRPGDASQDTSQYEAQCHSYQPYR